MSVAYTSLGTRASFAAFTVWSAVACATELGDKVPPDGAPGGTSGHDDAAIGTGADSGITVPDGGLADGSECAGETIRGELIPLDMYVMLDISGSMTDPDPTKWDAVKQALTSFLQDSGSDGLGVGIQYFPLGAPGAVEQCTSSAECGTGGICALKTCNGTGTITPCNTDADCKPGEGICVDLGVNCDGSGQPCLPAGNRCGPFGGCVRVTGAYCSNYWSCDAAMYAGPAVEIATLPGAAQPLIDSINAQAPSGRTPTSAALSGAIDHAKTWAQNHPGHRVVALLATDGLPTECAPTDIPQIAQIASAGLSGTPSITTFVVGVFTPDEAQQGKANLDTLALSGGSQSALIVDASQNVSRQFLDALNAIRGSSVACEFHVPTPPDGGTLDYKQVNMLYTNASGAKTTLYYVGNQASCDPQQGGWYYDVDPSSGGTPSKMIVCDTNCGTFKASGGQVDVKMGCQTVLAPPK